MPDLDGSPMRGLLKCRICGSGTATLSKSGALAAWNKRVSQDWCVPERPILFGAAMVRAILEGRKTQTRRAMKPQPAELRDIKGQDCPYGRQGERLWVRETFCVDEDDQPVVLYRATDHESCGQPWRPAIFMPRSASRITLEITAVRVERLQDISEEDAKAEGAEFGFCVGRDFHEPCDPEDAVASSYKQGFAFLWDSINAKRGLGWEANPWVWVVKFKRLS